MIVYNELKLQYSTDVHQSITLKQIQIQFIRTFGPGAAALIQRAVNAREAMAEVEPAVRCEEKARARAAGANRSMFTIL